MIEEYLNTYRMGSHCASTSLMNLCAYYGWSLSESLCFGLGEGLNFSFYKIEQTSTYCFCGRNRDIERNFFRNYGIEAEMKYCLDNNTVWSDFHYYINQQKKPILVKLDIGSLDYLKEHFKLTVNMDLSEHLAVIIGIEKDHAVISEYYQKKPIIVSKDELLKSMNKKFERKSINNLYYIIHGINPYQDLESCIKQAINLNAYEVQYGFGSNLGIPGLKKFVHDIGVFQEYMSFEQLKSNLLMANMAFEKVGTGGGNFRRIYARFLKEAGDTIKSHELVTISDTYSQLALLWKQVSKIFYDYANCNDFSNEFTMKINDYLNKILELETFGVSKLISLK